MDSQVLVKELVSQLDGYRNELQAMERRREHILGEIKDLDVTLRRVKAALKSGPAKGLIDPALRTAQDTLSAERPDPFSGKDIEDAVLAAIRRAPSPPKTRGIIGILEEGKYDFGVKDPFNKVWWVVKRLEKAGRIKFNKEEKTWSIPK